MKKLVSKSRLPVELEPRLLKYLLAVERTGSLVKAADMLNISQPAMSVGIARLEDLCGILVMDRGRNGSQLTEAGRMLAAHGERIEVVLRGAIAEIEHHKQGIAGPLSVGGTPLSNGSVTPYIVARLLKHNPQVSISMTEDADDGLMSRLIGNELDIVISHVGPHAERPEIEQHPLFQTRSVLVVRAGHPLADHNALSVHDVADEVWVLPPKGGAFYALIEAFFLTNGVPFPPPRLIEANPFGVLKTIVELTDGVSILSDQFLTQAITAGTLAAIPLREPLASRTFALQKVAGRRLSPLGNLFWSIALDFEGQP